MVQIPGAPDFQQQIAATTQLIGTFNYTTPPAAQTFDLTPFMQPHYQGLAVRFVRTVGAAATSVLLQWQIDGGDSLLIPFATLTDGATCIREVLGAIIVQGGHTLTMLCSENGGGTGNTQGVLEVYGLTYLPVQNEWTRPGRAFQIVSAANVVVASLAVVQVLPDLSPGFYYRNIRYGTRSNGAHAAGALITWAIVGLGAVFDRFVCGAANPEVFYGTLPLWAQGAPQVTNGTAGEIRADAYAEMWPLG